MLAYRSCASLTSERLPNSASASSKNSTRSPARGGLEDPLQVLLGLADVLAHHRGRGRPCRGRGRGRRRPPRRPGSCRCPDGPANSADHAGGRRAGNPSARGRRLGPVPGGQLAQLAGLVGGQDEVVPAAAAAGSARPARRGARRPAAGRRAHRRASARHRPLDQPQLPSVQPLPCGGLAQHLTPFCVLGDAVLDTHFAPAHVGEASERQFARARQHPGDFRRPLDAAGKYRRQSGIGLDHKGPTPDERLPDEGRQLGGVGRHRRDQQAEAGGEPAGRRQPRLPVRTMDQGEDEDSSGDGAGPCQRRDAPRAEGRHRARRHHGGTS